MHTKTSQARGQGGGGGGPSSGGGDGGGQAGRGCVGHVADHGRGAWAQVDQIVLRSLAQDLVEEE